MFVLPAEVVLMILRLHATLCEERWIEYLNDIHDPLALYHEPSDDSESTSSSDSQDSQQIDHIVPDRAAPYSWIRLTHVCRAWREIALSTSSLWTHIAIIRNDCTKEMLRRAVAQPLRLTMEYRDGPYWDLRIEMLLRFLEDCIGRVAAAVIPAFPNLISRTQARRAHQLRSLTLVEPSRYVPEGDDIPPKSEINPFEFPVLEHLHTTTELLGSFAHLFSRTLTSLKLEFPSNCSDGETLFVIMSYDLALALVQTPLLEILHVDLFDETPPIPPTLVVSLPKLRSLRLMGVTVSCTELFRALTIPRNATIELNYEPHHWLRDDAPSNALEALTRAAENPSLVNNTKFLPIRRLKVDHWGLHCTLEGWRTARPHALPPKTGNSAEKPDVKLNIVDSAHVNDVLECLAIMPFEDIETLHIAYACLDRESVLTATCALASMPSLRNLVLEYVSKLPYGVSAVASCTSANRLYLSNIVFWAAGSRNPSDAPNVTGLPNQGTAQDFIAACASRAQPFDEISLRNTRNFDADDFAQLQRVVRDGNVVWDGIVHKERTFSVVPISW